MILNTAVIMNGPPNSGKDTLAFMLEEYGFVKMAFKDQLYIETAKYFGVNLQELIRRASDRVLKEQPWKELEYTISPHYDESFYRTPRQALILTSENYIKPNQGDDYFGLAAVEACKKRVATMAVFSDGGFASEIKPLADAYKHVVIFRLHRKGCSFEGDSRSYLPGFDNTHDIHLVEGEPRWGLQEILDLLNPYIYDFSVAS